MMSKISSVNVMPLTPLLEDVKLLIEDSTALENAAQILTDIVYEQFSDSLALARMYATVPYGELPASNHVFVSELAAAHSITSTLKDDTLVLSLLGTRGIKSDWNDRSKSKNHVGIPLASAVFVDQIPMISRLLKEIGLDLDWIDSQDTNMITETIGGVSGVFYVEDARQAVDHMNRKIIPAQDFVEENDVNTVFGVAAGYPSTRTIITMIVFCREHVDKAQAELFLPLIEAFKQKTILLVNRGAIFDLG